MSGTNYEPLRSKYTRMWIIPNRAGPENRPQYQAIMRATEFTWPQGDVELIKIPDPSAYGKFITIGKTKGETGSPTISIQARYRKELSDLMDMLRNGCDADLQLHIGTCKNPQDFNSGFDKILVLEAAQMTDYRLSDLGALTAGDDSPVNEEIPFAGEDAYEIVPLVFSEEAADEVVQEIVGMAICDSVDCGECADPSNGCEKVFAVTKTAAGSPGLPAEVIFSGDAGVNWDDTLVDTLAADEDPTDMACVGKYLVICSSDSGSIHYAPLADILAGTETWTEVAIAADLNAIFSAGPGYTWCCADSGYIYKIPDVTVAAYETNRPSILDYYAIHGYDAEHVVAVGASNAVAVTSDGVEWTAITGPAVGVDLLSVWMKSPTEWFVGDDNGDLWYTRDGGATWTQKEFPGDGAGDILDIEFATPTVGYMAYKTATPAGRILRTIDGGYSWYVMPQGNTSIPANDQINKLAVCRYNPNVVYGGGLADDATDGIIVKASN